ncbi:MAG: Zn-dependent hydrolase [Proteobacteria bacterium]|nr:Zn-dependent hydrolase [Pseudomonadota bacterium]
MACAKLLLVPALLMVAACGQKESSAPAAPASKFTAADTSIQSRLDKYATVRLTTDLSKVSEQDRAVLGHFINAAEKIHDIFWQQAYGEPGPLLGGITDPALRSLVEINVGPWDRIDANAPFVAGVGPKPAGAQFYPVDMTKEEFEAFSDPAKTGLYSLVRRDEAGKLKLVPYSQAYATQLKPIAAELRSAAAITTDSQLKKYLELRATALETDDYRPSDFAWMEMKRNTVDLVIGPIENYEDQLFGYRTAFEAYVLVKDMQWSERLARFAKLLPELQRGLPVPAAYKKEPAGSASDLNAYDVVYVAGDANASTKTIAINLPNDEEVGLKAGTRRLQLKNAIQAKFEATLLPIAGELIAKDQLQHVNPDAFFANVMFHEVAHGLGIKNTLDGKGTVRAALKETYSAIEECKADILGLYLVTKLLEKKELKDTTLVDHYVTYVAGIVRSVRWGASNAHSVANMIEFNYFEDHGAFTRDAATGTYRVNVEQMSRAVTSLAERLIRLQGDGDYAAVAKVLAEEGTMRPGLQADLDRLATKNIPVDIVYEQDRQVLNLDPGMKP